MSVDANTPDPNLQIPDKSILYQIAGSAYAENFDGNVDGFTLLKQTPTLKIFKKIDYPVIVLGVRGTADFQDFMAWLPVVLNTIRDTDRYKKDTDFLLHFQQDYVPSQFYYYGTGHSIAGTILDEWLKAGLILKARTYNPAIQEGDLANASINNDRIYADLDPLYNMFGRRAKRAPEVRKSTKPFGMKQVAQFSFSPLYWFGKDILREHSWRNEVFQGGIRRQEI
jgi:hypothetical protein